MAIACSFDLVSGLVAACTWEALKAHAIQPGGLTHRENLNTRGGCFWKFEETLLRYVRSWRNVAFANMEFILSCVWSGPDPWSLAIALPQLCVQESICIIFIIHLSRYNPNDKHVLYRIFRFIRRFYVSLCISLHEMLLQLSPATACICEAYQKQKKEIEEDGDQGGKQGRLQQSKTIESGQFGKVWRIILRYFTYRFWNPLLVSRFGLLYIPNQMGSD